MNMLGGAGTKVRVREPGRGAGQTLMGDRGFCPVRVAGIGDKGEVTWNASYAGQG